MRTIEALMESPGVHRIGWALLHSLWQSAAVALVLVVMLRRLHRAPPEARYLAACVALVTMVTLPAATSGLLSPAAGLVDANGSVAPARRPGSIGGEAEEYLTLVARSMPHTGWLPLSGRPGAVLPALVAGWMIGIIALALRLLGGWLLVQRLGHRRVLPLGDPAGVTLARLARALRIRRGVRLLESSLIKVPMVIGGFRPLILLPVAALTGLTPGQLEALPAHELAHIRRHDYLVNLARSVIELLLFYHPAAWWVSRVIRAEREHCCDDLAVQACGDRLTYARALAAMEGLRDAPYLSVAATGGPLLGRVRRILNPEVESMYRLPIVGPGAAVLIGSLMLAGATAQQTDSAAQGARELRSEERSSSGRDPHTATVFVPTFRSVSFRRDVQFQLTELVQKQIEKRTPYKVVGNIEEADTILEGTVNFADKNIVVENPFSLPRQLTATIHVTVNWIHNPPHDSEKNREPTLVSDTVYFAPELGETSTTAFSRVNQDLATQIVDAMERLASRERQARPADRSPERPSIGRGTGESDSGRPVLPSRGPDEAPASRLASKRGGGPGSEFGATPLLNESESATARGRVGVRSFSEDPPTEEEVWRKVPKFDVGSPSDEVQRNNVRIEFEKIGEKVDPRKVYPLVGPCQRVHRFYKCTVTFDERRRPAELATFGERAVRRVEVIYLDKDHLRRCPDSPATP